MYIDLFFSFTKYSFCKNFFFQKIDKIYSIAVFDLNRTLNSNNRQRVEFKNPRYAFDATFAKRVRMGKKKRKYARKRSRVSSQWDQPTSILSYSPDVDTPFSGDSSGIGGSWYVPIRQPNEY